MFPGMTDELSDEQKRRILDEERQRMTEERYRAQVRRQLEAQAYTQAQADSPGPVESKAKSTVLRNVLIFVGAFAVSCAAVIVAGSFWPRTGQPQSAVPPVTSSVEVANKPSPLSLPAPQKLTTAQIAEKATPS